jgi:transposase InsO family protein
MSRVRRAFGGLAHTEEVKGNMDADMQRQMALLRFSIIAPLCNDTYDAPSKEAFCRQLAQKTYVLPNGGSRRFAAQTIKNWVLLYKKHGFSALEPKGRNDLGKPRILTEGVISRIYELKEKYPHITGTLIHQKLIEDGSIKQSKVSKSTILRFIKANHLSRAELEPVDRKAFEMEHANDCWQADSSVGPVITVNGRKTATWLISFIDDASRLITHAEFYFNDNGLNVQLVLKKAIYKFGVPKRLYLDNGSSYANNQLQLICASLGIVLIHTPPYSPENKGKIERSFRTIKDTWMNGLDWGLFHDLPSLNHELSEFVNGKYNNKEHSVIKATPKDRWLADAALVRHIPQDVIEDSFLHRIDRKVYGDATIRIDSVIFEVPPQYIGHKINVRYSPGNLSLAYIFNDKYVAEHTIFPLRRVDNSKVKRKTIDYSWGGADV